MYDLICSTRSSGLKYQLHLEWLALVVSVCVVVAPSTASGRCGLRAIEAAVRFGSVILRFGGSIGPGVIPRRAERGNAPGGGRPEPSMGRPLGTTRRLHGGT